MGKVTLTDSFYRCDECGVTSKERDSNVWGEASTHPYDYFDAVDSVFYRKIFCSDMCMSAYVDTKIFFNELTPNQLCEMFEERHYLPLLGNTD